MTFPLDVTQGNVVLGSLNGTLKGGATFIPGMIGNAVYFGGNLAYVDFGTHTSGCFFDPSQCNSGIAVSFWLRIDSTISSFEIFVDNGGCEYGAIGFCVWGDRDVLGITRRVAISWFNARIPMPVLMKWNFITVSINAVTMKIFVNGCHILPTVEDAGTQAVASTIHLPWVIGGHDNEGPQFAIDNIGIWYTELTPKEVWDIYSDANGNSTIWTIGWMQ